MYLFVGEHRRALFTQIVRGGRSYVIGGAIDCGNSVCVRATFDSETVLLQCSTWNTALYLVNLAILH